MERDRKAQSPLTRESRRPFSTSNPADRVFFSRAQRSSLVRRALGQFPGLKPRAESCSPCGAKTRSIISIAISPLRSASNFVTPSLRAKTKPSTGASFVALFLAAMLQWAALLAVCPTLHELIHHDADDEHHDCAVTLFLAGQIEQAFIEPIAFGQSAPVELLLDRTYGTVVYGSFFLSRCILEHAPPLVR
jgi:hypothetical protein